MNFFEFQICDIPLLVTKLCKKIVIKSLIFSLLAILNKTNYIVNFIFKYLFILMTPMGRIFSKPRSLRDILYTLEEKIKKQEGRVKCSHKRNEYIRGTFWKISFSIMSFVCLFAYLDATYKYLIPLTAIFLIFIYITLKFILEKHHFLKEKELFRLQELQKKNIETLKMDKVFLETKSIYDKYEKDQKKESNSDENEKIKVSKRGLIEKVADVVLGEDQENKHALICSHCYMHNGLRYPHEDISKFICFNCKMINTRRRNGKSNTNINEREDKI
ncbi:hypothetical protein EDEG_00359 [Edhazardia aedis USNM 41457]|uniref:Lunapark zinc ribbon domain-containing protein n=1 Tax=Edhazardia aedis (strain USNM 41457) TaxID=1003232 RepID=J8ZPZ8_EDHAE|nr:hypothetical protein EDEG_00359 [Edhazardia aedis USNM 41457]|eukprot:EJW01768.1 hypothetical protein EDEG_00359 [Edhazardia aedis USNM 41457]